MKVFASAALALGLLIGGSAHANVVVFSNVAGDIFTTPVGGSLIDFNSISTGSPGPSVPGAAGYSFSGGYVAGQPDVPSSYAAPFGDLTQYFTTGSVGG